MAPDAPVRGVYSGPVARAGGAGRRAGSDSRIGTLWDEVRLEAEGCVNGEGMLGSWDFWQFGGLAV
jgi:hypothetical protein